MEAVRTKISVFDAITRMRVSGNWRMCLAMFSKAQTLDYYYRIFQLLEEFEPERTRGYRARFCYNLHVCSDLWGGVS